MAIVSLNRFQLIFFSKEKNALLKALQRMGQLHIEEMRPVLKAEQPQSDEETTLDGAIEVFPDSHRLIHSDFNATETASLEETLQTIERLISQLSPYQRPKKGLEALNTALPEITFDDLHQRASQLSLEMIQEAVESALAAQRKEQEETEELRAERSGLIAYRGLDLPFDALRQTKKIAALVGRVPKRFLEPLLPELRRSEAVYVEVVGEDEAGGTLFLLMAPHDESVQGLLQTYAFSSENRPGNLEPTKRIEEIDERLEALRQQAAQTERILSDLAESHLGDLKLLAEYKRTQRILLRSRQKALETPHLYMVKGYVPSSQEADLQKCLESTLKFPYSLEQARVERKDPAVESVPILLENKPLIKPFESLVSIYSLPRYDEVDPTFVTAVWYAACFGLMLGDLGYGLVMLLLTTLARRFLKMSSSMEMNVRFFQILSFPTIAAGLLYGSFFSMTFPSVIDSSGESMLVYSILFGEVMLFFGLGVKIFMNLRDGDPLAAVYDCLTWIAAIVGAELLLFGSSLGLGAGAEKVGKGLLIAGLLGILIFSARNEKSWGARLGWGAYNVYGISSWLGDLVSYTRIAALVMSGGFIGYAINLIAGMVATSWVGSLISVIILVVFHAFNLFLSALSAYVHSMRLAYVEFYGKFYEGGGIPFESLREESKYYDVR